MCVYAKLLFLQSSQKSVNPTISDFINYCHPSIVIEQHSVSIQFQMAFDKTKFKLTTVYGPLSHTNRQAFLDELQTQRPNSDMPWILIGDFNQTINITDRSNTRKGPDRPFVSFVQAMELIDLPLTGRRYTWSTRRDNPSFVCLDRVLITSAWNSTFPNTNQQALYSNLSDHCPMQCKINTMFLLSNTFRFENYWLKLEEFKHLVIGNWHNTDMAQNPWQLVDKLRLLRQQITNWNENRVGNMDTQTHTCNRVLHWIIRAEETRTLTTLEKLLRTLLMDRLTKLGKLMETK